MNHLPLRGLPSMTSALEGGRGVVEFPYANFFLSEEENIPLLLTCENRGLPVVFCEQNKPHVRDNSGGTTGTSLNVDLHLPYL